MSGGQLPGLIPAGVELAVEMELVRDEAGLHD
jgi:hypothetical protein